MQAHYQLLNSPQASKPVIVIDTREQIPLFFEGLPFVSGTLQSGDYSIRGCEELFAIERKSVAGFVGCCVGVNRQRFERELHRLRGFRFKRLLIVGSRSDIEQHRYRSALPPNAALATLSTFEMRYEIPTVWAATPEQAANMIESWAFYFSRELLKVSGSLSNALSRDPEFRVTVLKKSTNSAEP